ALAELSVALPFAGGPLAYGRRAVDPSLGFVMGWSMFLECQFATIATALATGGYLAFLLEPVVNAYLVAYPNGAPAFLTDAETRGPAVEVAAALVTVLVFFLLHSWGVR